MDHDLELIPQTIVDGWQAKCTCGWHTFASFYEFKTKEELLAELKRRFDAHGQSADG